jgi:hypothetical protein
MTVETKLWAQTNPDQKNLIRKKKQPTKQNKTKQKPEKNNQDSYEVWLKCVQWFSCYA